MNDLPLLARLALLLALFFTLVIVVVLAVYWLPYNDGTMMVGMAIASKVAAMAAKLTGDLPLPHKKATCKFGGISTEWN